ncbi:MAG: methionine biosynthesis protein MetW, partial [Acidobacteriota bacterium]
MADQPGEPLDAVLRRLRTERDEADARYNEALTALDQALRPPALLPRPAPGLDEYQIAPLNDAWNILPAPPQASGPAGKLTGFIWRVVAPYLQRQLTFNSLFVDHVNRNAAARREAHRAAEAATATLNAELASMAAFQARLMLYLQQITAYVDTKDRDTAGGALVLNGALSGMAEVLDKRFESMTARGHRDEARTAGIVTAQDELRGTLGVVQQGFMTLKRELESLRAHAADPSPRNLDPGSRTANPEARTPDAGPANTGAFAPPLDAYKYLGFEDQFRGSREVILARFQSYVPLFQGAAEVLDVGCGRGEFLDLLSAAGVTARGLDLNH